MSDQPTVPGMPSEYRAGTVLAGRYELRGVLGRGGMATVWRAHDSVLARDVAVKVFTDVSAHPDPAGAARATAEVRILAGLSHPNVVAVFDASGATGDDFDHLVMELVDGRSLRQRLDEGPLPQDDTARLGAELAAGLEYVHERGVVHRDLKPANVLLERTRRGDRAKLADFGVARLLESAPLTMVGTTVGTANYLSPEQATGHDITPASDVYSLGLVLLECLTGVLAYPGSGVAAASARLHRPPHIPAGLDARWQSLLREMTALDPAARPDTADVAARLAALAAAPEAGTTVVPAASAATRADHTAVLGAAPAGGTAVLGAAPAGGTAVLGAAPAGGTAVLPTPPDRSRRRAFAVLGAVGLVLALVVGFLLATGGGDDVAPPAAPSTTPPAARTTAPSATPTTASAVRSSSAPTTATTAAPVTRTRTRTVEAPAEPPGQQKKNKDDKAPKPGGGGPGKPAKP